MMHLCECNQGPHLDGKTRTPLEISDEMVERATRGMVGTFEGLPPVHEMDQSAGWWKARRREARAALEAALGIGEQ